jgi:2-dehydro-3-deoxyphosphogluconate aldolase/(4S)-4-hydroxy-2-oxoglutarate aldolase
MPPVGQKRACGKPGIATPSDLMQVLAAGFTVAKFFPAVPAGGMAALKALGTSPP